MARVARWSLAVIAWAFIAACASETPLVEPLPSEPAPPSAAADMVGVRLGGLTWVDAGERGMRHEDRFALLLGGFEAGGAPSFAENNLRLVHETLEGACHVPPTAIVELAGPALRPDGVREAIAELGQRARSRDALLLVYLSGLSVVDEAGVLRYLGAGAERKLDGRWGGTFTRDELNSWLAEATERAAAAGCRLSTVFVSDVVRPVDSTPNPGVPYLPAATWELHAHAHSRAVEQPSNPAPTPFTRSFVNSLRELATEGRAAPVEQVFERTRQALLSSTAGRQEPGFVAPAGEHKPPRLVAPRRIACSVLVRDALSGLPLEDASVSVDARHLVQSAKGGSVAQTLLHITPLPGQHLLRVSAPGHLTRVEQVSVGVENAGKVLEVCLLPSLVHVQGWLSPPTAVQVSVERVEGGLLPGALAGYHVLRVQPGADGRFELRVPRLGDPLKLVVRRGGDVVMERALPLRPDRFLNVSNDVVEGLGLVDIGPLQLPGANPLTALRAAELAMLRGGGPAHLPLPAPYTRPHEVLVPIWTNEEDAERWKLFGSLSGREQWLPALAQLDALSDRVPAEFYEAWRGWLEMGHAQGIGEASPLQKRLASMPSAYPDLALALGSRVLALHLQWTGSRALAAELEVVNLLAKMPLELTEGESDYGSLLIGEVHARRRGVAATLFIRLADQQRWTELLDAIQRLGVDGTWATPEFTELRREALVAALEAELEGALAEGLLEQDWSAADRVLGWMTEAGAQLSITGTPIMLALAERITVERVSVEVRNRFREAQAAFLRGDLLQADELYSRLEGRVRGRYADFVSAQRSHLRPQLFVRELKQGEELELEGDLDGAAAAYARALTYDRRAAMELMRLGLSTPGVSLVTTDGRAGFTEITPALSASRVDGVVLVGPGRYGESLVLKGSRTLLGVGGEVVVVTTTGSALSVPAGADVAVSGLTLRTEARGLPTVRVDDGQLLMESCRIEPPLDGSALALGGHSSEAQLRRCEVPAAEADGFVVSTDARLDLVDCSIGLPGTGVGELRRFFSTSAPRHIRVTDSVFGRYVMSGSSRLSDPVLVRMQRSNTIRVAADSSSWPAWAIDQLTHCATLTEALELAEAGATLLVQPGVYRESLRPTRAVRILAEGFTAGGADPAAPVVVDGGQSEYALVLDADVSVAIQGITFRLHKPVGEQRSEAVSVRRGHLELTDCRIEAFDSTDSWQPDALAIGSLERTPAPQRAPGSELDPEQDRALAEAQARRVTSSVVLRRCRITSDATGITLHGDSNVSVWDSEIVGRLAGVRPSAGAHAELVATTIRGGAWGLRLSGPWATASLEACLFTGNEQAIGLDDGAVLEQVRVAGTTVR